MAIRCHVIGHLLNPFVDIQAFTPKMLKPRHPQRRDPLLQTTQPLNTPQGWTTTYTQLPHFRKVRDPLQAITSPDWEHLREEREVLHHLQAACSSYVELFQAGVPPSCGGCMGLYLCVWMGWLGACCELWLGSTCECRGEGLLAQTKSADSESGVTIPTPERKNTRESEREGEAETRFGFFTDFWSSGFSLYSLSI